jgi:hypothetical protein
MTWTVAALVLLWICWVEYRLAKLQGHPWKLLNWPPADPIEPLPVILRGLGKIILLLFMLYTVSLSLVGAMAGVSFLISQR